MSILSWASRLWKKGPQNRAFSEEFWSEPARGGLSSSGAFVNWKTALSTPTALRCGMLISDGVSTVPLKLMHKDPANGTRREAKEHPLYDLMHTAPCDWMTSQQMRETLMLRAVFCGAGHAFINRVGGGSRRRVFEMYPLEPGDVSVQKETGGPRPVYQVNGVAVPAENILTMRGPSWDGRVGLDMVSLARDVIGLADAAQDAHAKRFANGVQTTGVYSVDGPLNETQHKLLTEWIAQKFSGPENSGRPLVLDRGAKWQPTGMSGVDAEHLDTRQYQDMQIARHFGVLPAVVGIADKTASFASSEQMFLAHVVHTIRPWHVRVCGILNFRLLTPQERSDGYYFHFVDTALLRGAAKDRAEYYGKLFTVGAFSPNDILSMEDMDGFAGGDVHFAPSNHAVIEKDGGLRLASKPE